MGKGRKTQKPNASSVRRRRSSGGSSQPLPKPALLAGLSILMSVLALVLGTRLVFWRGQAILCQHELATSEQETRQSLSALRSQVEQLTQDSADLQARLEQAEQEARQARQALADRLTDEFIARRDQTSDYSGLYTELYAQPADLGSQAPGHTVYLTFDDGPSARTGEVLDILKENNIKATFFVTGQTSQLAQDMMKRIVEEGHTIAVHTYSHNYGEIYTSVVAYLEDFDRIYRWIHEVTGVYPQIFRFPGGSVNGYNQKIYEDLIEEMDRRGFVHFDWNAINGDAEGVDYSVGEMVQKALSKVGADRVILLMHDSVYKTRTVEALQRIISGYQNAGYSFAPLTPEVKSITFH